MIGENPKMIHKMGNGDLVASLDFVGKICCRYFDDGKPMYVAVSLDGKDQRTFGDKSSYRRTSVGSA
jgi:hypothetical protein